MIRSLGPFFFAVSLVFGLAVLVLPTPSRAGGWEAGVLAGIGIPTGDFADEDNGLDAGNGPQFGVELGYHMSHRMMLGIDASWNRNKRGLEGETFDLGGGITVTSTKDRFITRQYGLFGRYLFAGNGSFQPFATVGLGFYHVEEDYEDVYDDNGTVTILTDEDAVASGNFEQPGTRFGYRIGLGGDYMTSPTFGIGMSVDYNVVSMDEDETLISSAPFISIRGRLTYHFLPKE